MLDNVKAGVIVGVALVVINFIINKVSGKNYL